MDRLPDRQPERQRDPGCAFPGNPGRPTAAQKRAMVDLKARELAEGQYDRLSARDRALLVMAATLLCRRPRTREDHVRTVNAVGRLLGRVHGLRQAGPAPPSFDEPLP
jgi:hypothetical protein